MIEIDRRRFIETLALGTATLTVSGFSQPARAADYVYKVGHGFTPSHPISVAIIAAADKINRDTNGALQIDVYGSSQLGGDSNMLSQLRGGSLEFLVTAGFALGALVPAASVFAIGFAFENYGAVWRAVDGDLGGNVRSKFSDFGLAALSVMDNGFRHMSSNDSPIRSVADLRGKKYRVPVAPIMSSMLSALGATPVTLNFNEVYMALQTNLVDGMESPLTVYEMARLYEVQKYISLTKHAWDGGWLIANEASFSSLPQDFQDVVIRNFNDAALSQRRASEKMNQELELTLGSMGVEFITPEIESFKAALVKAGYYVEWRDKFDVDTWRQLVNYAPHIG